MSPRKDSTKHFCNFVKRIINLLFLLFICSSCQNEEPKPQSNSINKIMPLGASRVEGDRPNYESYRYELWKKLVNDEWTFDFVGTQTDNAFYDNFINLSFDTDHEGRGGWTSEQILNGIDNWLADVGSVDVVLLSSPGGNDILGGANSFEEVIVNINLIIDKIQTSNPNVTILIEQMAPGRTDFMTPEFNDLFSQSQSAIINLADQQTNSSSRVIAIDMFTGFNDTHLADEVHYNEKGAKFIADRYYGVLKNILQE